MGSDRNSSVIVVGKGPSAAAQVREVLKRESVDVAVINDSGRLLPASCRIDWCFWTDMQFIEKTSPFQHRVGCFVSPLEPAPERRPAWYDSRNTVHHGWRYCGYDDLSLAKRIMDGGICHHHTTPGAVHWLAKHAWYERILIVGIDGGKGVCNGVYENPRQIRDLENMIGKDFRDQWNVITRRICHFVERVYAVTIEWEPKP